MSSISLPWKAWNVFENIKFGKDLIRKYFEYQINEIIDRKLNSFLAGCGIPAGCFGLVILGYVSYYKLHTNQKIKRNPETKNKQDNDENQNILHIERKTTIQISGEKLIEESIFWRSSNAQCKPNVKINLSENGELVITQKLDPIENKVFRSAYKSPNSTSQPDIPVFGQPNSSAHCEQRTVDKKVIENLTNKSEKSPAAAPTSDAEDIQNPANQPDNHV